MWFTKKHKSWVTSRVACNRTSRTLAIRIICCGGHVKVLSQAKVCGGPQHACIGCWFCWLVGDAGWSAQPLLLLDTKIIPRWFSSTASLTPRDTDPLLMCRKLGFYQRGARFQPLYHRHSWTNRSFCVMGGCCSCLHACDWCAAESRVSIPVKTASFYRSLKHFFLDTNLVIRHTCWYISVIELLPTRLWVFRNTVRRYAPHLDPICCLWGGGVCRNIWCKICLWSASSWSQHGRLAWPQLSSLFVCILF